MGRPLLQRKVSLLKYASLGSCKRGNKNSINGVCYKVESFKLEVDLYILKIKKTIGVKKLLHQRKLKSITSENVQQTHLVYKMKETRLKSLHKQLTYLERHILTYTIPICVS